MNRANFLYEITRLFRIAFVQKAVVILLRAAWVGGAVYIFIWGSNRLWGWFPRQDLWILYAALTAAAILATLLRYVRPNRAFVWRVDRRFELNEQVFTAYERVSRIPEGKDDDSGTQMLLGSEAVGSLPKLRRRVAGRSWQFQREIESTIVVLLMLVVVYLAGIGSIDRISARDEQSFLPPVPKEPQTTDIFSSGIPGKEITLEEGADSDQPQAITAASMMAYCDPAQSLVPDVWLQVQEVLTQLGNRLCCGSATMVLSQALIYRDYQTAGDQFSVMAEKIVDYSDETRQLLATQLLETSVQFEQIGQAHPSSLFSSATAALMGKSYAGMAEGLDSLAVLMQQYQNQQRCVTIVEWQPGGQWIPAQPGAVFSGMIDVSTPSDFFSLDGSPFTSGNSEIPFYQIPMEDADVVSSYFSPE